MAGVGFVAQTAQVATGTSAKTILQVIAATNQRVLVNEISISFEGIDTVGVPIQVRVLRQTTAGTMSSLTPVKNNSGDDETLQVTAQHTATVEPTASDVLLTELVHPQTGFIWQARFGDEIVVKGGTRLGIEVTAAAGVDCVARIRGQE